MAVLFFSGAETGDFSEFTAVNGSMSVQTTTVNTGNYAITTSSLPTTNSTAQYAYTSTQSTAYLRGYLQLHGLAASMVINQFVVAFMTQTSSGGTILRISITTDASGNPSINVFNAVSAAQVGSAFAVPLDAWFRVECQLTISATVGVVTLLVNGQTAATGSNLNTGTTNVGGGSVGSQNSAATGSPSGTVYWDDLQISSTGFPGAGGCIARQFNGTAPNYNTFTFVGGANVQSVWDDTPFNTATNATDAVSAGKQTGVANFSNATDTGATGHGGQFITTLDKINAAKIGAVAKTGTASDAADSTIFRTPAGGSGVDTVTAFAAGWATTDGYKENILGTTPTAGQILSCEAGIQHNATTNTHTYEDVWIMADFTPGVMYNDWNYWSLGGARLNRDRELEAQRAQSELFRLDLQHQNPPPPKLTAHQWEFQNQIPIARQKQEEERVMRQVAAVELYYQYLQRAVPPRLTPHLWEWWNEIPAAREGQRQDRESRLAAVAQYALWYLQEMPPPKLTAHTWQFWTYPQYRSWNPALFNSSSDVPAVIPPAPEAFERNWSFWTYPQYQDWRTQPIAPNLLWNRAEPPVNFDTPPEWDFWNLGQVGRQPAIAQARAVIANALETYPYTPPRASDFPPSWQWWLQGAQLRLSHQEWHVLHQLLWRNVSDQTHRFTAETFHFWMVSLPPVQRVPLLLSIISNPGVGSAVTPPVTVDPIIVWRHRAGMQ